MPPVSALAPSAPEITVPPQQEASPYLNPMNQVYSENGKALPQTVCNPTCGPAVYDPMANVPLLTEGTSPHQTVIVSSQSGNSNKRKRCRRLKVCSVIFPILFLIGGCLRAIQRSQYRQDMQKIQLPERSQKQIQERLQKQFEQVRSQPSYYLKNLDQIRREIGKRLVEQNNHQNRYKRSFDEPWKSYKDYDFDSLNDATMAMVNTLVKSRRVVTEQPRYHSRRTNWSNYKLFKRSAREKLIPSSEISVT